MQKTVKTPAVAIIIPAYNEALTIATVISKFHSALPEAQMVVVDNRSTDDTGALARQAIEDCGAQGMVLFEPLPGKGNAVRRAFHDVVADVYVMIDADMTYHPEDLPMMLDPILKGQADVVIGDRLSSGDYGKENKRLFHGIGNKLVVGLINLLFRVRMRDVMSGYRVMTRRFVEHTPILHSGFELETESTIFALDNRFRIVEVPIRYTDRPAGSFSKLNTYFDGIRVIFTIIRILRDYRPSYFFGSFAIGFLGIGLALGSLPVMEFIKYGWVYRVPTAILASALILLSMLLAGVSLILNSMKNYFRALFEIILMRQNTTGIVTSIKPGPNDV